LDLSNNTALLELNVSYNQLTNLDLSNNIKLEVLEAYNNRLTSLDLSKNTELAGLAIDNNRLTSLDLSKNTELIGLDVSDNLLTSLNLSKNTMLGWLAVDNNQLTSLDLSENTILQALFVSGNQLTSLDLSNNTELEMLDVSDNYILSKDDIVGLDDLELYEFALGKQNDPKDLPGPTHNAAITTKKNVSLSFAGIRKGQINLNLKSGNYAVELYNVQGRLINRVDINATNGLNATGLKTSNLSKGVFILNVKQSGVSVLLHKIAIK
jgi:hypothetical protein